MKDQDASQAVKEEIERLEKGLLGSLGVYRKANEEIVGEAEIFAKTVRSSRTSMASIKPKSDVKVKPAQGLTGKFAALRDKV